MPRTLPPCPHRPPCPGCPRYGVHSAAPGIWGELAELAATARLPAPQLHTGELLGFRQRARLAVRGRASSPKLGIFQAGSHRIADIPRCGVHHPLINEVAAALRGVIRELDLPPYVERSGRGLLRYVQIAVSRDGPRAQLVWVANGGKPGELADATERLAARLGDALGGVWWNGNASRGNAILGPDWALLRGEPMLAERVAGVEVRYPPGAFMQSGFALAEQMAAALRQRVPDGARVVEYYAGTGAVGLGLLERAASVAFNEVEPHALDGQRAGIALRPEAEQARASVHPGGAGANAGLVADADVVLVDPPRKGLDPELLDTLCARPHGRLLYASCGWPALARELGRLREAGWKLEQLEGWDLFPYTEHVEIVACLDAG